MKLLLTGASGLLGEAVIQQASSLGWECCGLKREFIWNCKRTELAAKIANFDIVIHCAANTDVEYCQIDPDGCYRDNYLLTEILSKAAADAGIKMAFISSTGVYGNSKDEPYREYDQPNPTTIHHASKYLAEEMVLQSAANNLIIRTGWLFGGAVTNPKNFVARRIYEARELVLTEGVIRSNKNQKGVPCFNQDIAARLLRLVIDDRSGIYNCVNSSSATRLEYVSAIIGASKLPVVVQAVDPLHFKRKANVAINEVAINWKMDCLDYKAMPTWQNSLNLYIKNIIHVI
jgi:dTDP-4-dehydrorhamnose reductase